MKNSKINFLIISHPRCGSTLLCESLNEHPCLNVYKEALHPLNEEVLNWRSNYTLEVYGIENLPIIKDLAYTRISNRKDLHLLTNRIFSDYNGFKILTQQLPEHYTIWNHFVKNKDLRIIILKRKNLLNAALSNQIAKKTKLWQARPNEKIIDDPVFIDPKFLHDFFNHSKYSLQNMNVLFKKHKKINIEYETLCNNWDSSIFNIEKFLKIDKLKIPMMTGKRTLGKPQNLILNYKELKKYFKGTEWAGYFSEKIFL